MRLALLVALAAACSGGVPGSGPPTAAPTARTTATPRAYHAIGGEVMEYRGTLRGLRVGRVEVAVGKLGWVDDPAADAGIRHRGLIVRSTGKSEGLVAMIADLTFELTSALDFECDGTTSSVFDAVVELPGEKPEHEHREGRYEGDEQDLHGAAAIVRGWRSQLGDRSELVVVLGPLHLDVELWDAGRERVWAAERSIAAARYEGVVEDKYRFVLWLSDDAARVPLRLRTGSKWGEIVVELVHYEPAPE